MKPGTSSAPKLRFDQMPPAQQSGILCNDPQFQKFAAIRSGMPNDQFNPAASATYLRSCCKINSRRDLATNQTALKTFQALRTDFDAWRGRIAGPRT